MTVQNLAGWQGARLLLPKSRSVLLGFVNEDLLGKKWHEVLKKNKINLLSLAYCVNSCSEVGFYWKKMLLEIC